MVDHGFVHTFHKLIRY